MIIVGCTNRVLHICINTVIYWSRNDGLRWGRYCWGPLLIGGVVGRCCRVAKWPASVGWRFSDIGNWFPDIGKSNTFPDIGKSIPDIRKSFPDIGKLIISRYRKLISRYREFKFPISGNNSRYREMLNKNPNAGPKWLSIVSVPIFGVPLDLLLQDLWSHYGV